jgi:hypothetical protein
MSPPRLRTVGILAVLVGALLLALRAVEVAIAAGAPGWVNIVALVLAWDAIKFSVVLLLTPLRLAGFWMRCSARRGA